MLFIDPEIVEENEPDVMKMMPKSGRMQHFRNTISMAFFLESVELPGP